MVWRWLRAALAGCLAATLGLLLAQTQITVGEGSPTSAVTALFLQAFLRNDFNLSVSLPPKNKARRVGPGYVQDFNDVNTERNHPFSLVKPDSQEAVYQMCCEILTLHSSIGSFTGQIAFPVGDPLTGVQSVVDGSISTQQNFEGGHAIVAHTSGALQGQAFFIRDPYVSKWRVTPALAFPVGQERNTTSRFTTTATQQDFQGGTIVQITSGSRNGEIYVVSGLMYQRYAELGQGGSFLGFPIGDETTSSGRQRQNFEGGLMEYIPGQGGVTARAPVASVVIDAATVNLQVGNVISRSATLYDNLGSSLTDRPVSWTTSNRAVVAVESAGLTVTLRAVGPGFANIQAIADGVASAVLRITVTSTCCLVGEGAPTASVRQTFQDALSRNNITARLPTDNPARRVGTGYTQEFTALAPASLGRFQVMKADAAGQAYVVSGERLARHLELGSVVGALGFAASDSNAAGRQLFENNYALAGSPPRLVAAPITQKWAAMGYETGAAGLPKSDPGPAEPTLFGTAGSTQAFTAGTFYAHASGTRAAQAFLVSGLIEARYLAIGGLGGALGLPISDAFSSAGRIQQNFEGGSVDYAPGDAQAQERLAARRPAVTANPAQLGAGSRVRISISGFAPGRTLRVSLSSQPDFEVSPQTGAFAWDLLVPPGTAAGIYRVTARDTAGGETAEGAYRVRAAEEIRPQLTKLSGDNQVGLPASEAAQPLVVRLTDDAGLPMARAVVRFAALAPAVALPAQAITDANGLAQTRLRLPPSNGLVLMNAEAAGRLVTFAARAEDGRLTSFPAFRQAIDDIPLGNGAASIHKKGSLLTALAALFRYYQDRGELPAPAGLAEPAALNQFLRAGGFLPFTLNGRPELVLNPLRALAFVSDAADFETVAPTADSIRDSLNLRRPVLLALMLRSENAGRGGHYVVAMGVGPDGAILIHDPSPDWNRATLGEYLSGFTALGRSWSATLLDGLRLRLEPRSPRGFLIHGPGAARVQVAAPAAVRGYRLLVPALAAYDELVVDAGDRAELWYVDGAAPQYQVTAEVGGFSVRGTTVFESLARGAWRVTPDPLAVSPQTLGVATLLDAAGFRARNAAGALASLFGAGLAESTTSASSLPLPDSLGGLRVTLGGLAARLLFVSPFQANLQLPFGLPPGPHALEATSPYGSARLDITLDAEAPGIFTRAVVNPDGALNDPLNPARRGGALLVFTTGLGRVAPPVETGAAAPASPLARADAAVTATLGGVPVQVLYAGLAPGFAGLYQVNLLIPPSLAPGSALELILRAGGAASNAVAVAVQ